MKKLLILLALLVPAVSRGQGAVAGGAIGYMLGSSSSQISNGGGILIYRMPRLEERLRNPMGVVVKSCDIDCTTAHVLWDAYRRIEKEPDKYEVLGVTLFPHPGNPAVGVLWFIYAPKSELIAWDELPGAKMTEKKK